jgi:GDP-mannose 6-dehydrogenase
MLSISIFGLGYVGTVTAACLASRGHQVIGVDPNPLKVDRINAGMSPIVENRVPELITAAHAAGLISATKDPVAAITNSQVSIISVGTPSQRNGKLDLSHVLGVCADIGQALRAKDSFHWILLRSTVLPGTTESLVIPAIEAASGKKSGVDFVMCFNPEFLREGSAVADFANPPFTILGADCSSHQIAPIRDLYSFLDRPLFQTAIAAAEMIKYSCNAFHALKVAFANEIGTVCNAIGIDAETVADIFKSDTRLNISPAYLKPGFAFGGSCLPKDLRALMYKTKELDLMLPLLESILPSNSQHIDRATDAILSLSKRKIGVLGLSFKPGTDDLRESPMVHLVKKLIAEGCQIEIWDENVSLGQLIGSNRQFIESYLPHIGTLLSDDRDSVVADADVVLLGTDAVSAGEILKSLRSDQYLFDLANLKTPVLKRSPSAVDTGYAPVAAADRIV